MNTDHVRDIGGAEVRVEQTDRNAHSRERQCQVDRGGRLSHAALPTKHGHDVTIFTKSGAATVGANIVALLRRRALFTELTVTVTDVATQPKDDLVLATGLSAEASHLATRDKQQLKCGD